MLLLKSHWYYWYIGHKVVAVASMITTAFIMSLGLIVGAGFSWWSVITAVLLDVVGLWLIALYMLILRAQVPVLMREQSDAFVLNQLIIPVVVVFVIGRLVTYIFAKIFITFKT